MNLYLSEGSIKHFGSFIACCWQWKTFFPPCLQNIQVKHQCTFRKVLCSGSSFLIVLLNILIGPLLSHWEPSPDQPQRKEEKPWEGVWSPPPPPESPYTILQGSCPMSSFTLPSAFNPLTPKIWLSILPSSCYTFPFKLVKSICC